MDRYGPNRLPSAQKTLALTLLLRQIRSPLMYALLASAALALMLGEVADGLVVAAVVLLNAVIGFFQEFRAERAITPLAELVAEPARVCRDEAWTELPAEQVVPGDLVAVGQGDRIAADLRLLEVEGLRTREAALTGESAPADKGIAAISPEAPLTGGALACAPSRGALWS